MVIKKNTWKIIQDNFQVSFLNLLSFFRRFYTRRNASGMSRRHCFFLLLHMRKSFVYWHFPEMSIPLKSKNHFNFFPPNKCRFLFKPIIFVYSCKQSESLQHGLFTVHNLSEMAVCFNLNNNEISKQLLVNMILNNQGRLMLNDQKIPLLNEPQRSPGLFRSSHRRCFVKKCCS